MSSWAAEIEGEELEEFIPSGKTVRLAEEPREISLRVVILASILAVILGAANVYLGLFAGLTVSASIPASVLSMSILRALCSDVSILENNLVQTGASAGEALAAGVIFTFPALLILGNGDDENLYSWTSINYPVIIIMSICGGVMGIMFSIPIRRALILETKPPLAFPEGVACANVLKAGERGNGSSAGIVLKAATLGGISKGFLATNLATEAIGMGFIGHKAVIFCSATISPALFGVGYIVGWKITLVFLIGGIFNWLIFLPLATGVGIVDSGNYSNIPGVAAQEIYSEYTRFLGVGSMLVGGLYALVTMRSALMKGVSAGINAFTVAAKSRNQTAIAREDQDIPLPYCIAICIACVIPFYIIISVFLEDWLFSIVLSAFVVIFGFFASSVAAYMAGLVGSSNNPISGVTICVVLVTSLVLYGYLGASNIAPAAVIYVSAMIACAGAISGDNMQDLKTGHILGATPWKQQVLLMFGVIVSAFAMPVVLDLLNSAYGFGTSTDDDSNTLPAPQASLMASVALGVIKGGLPWGWVFAGALTAILVILIDNLLQYYSVPFSMPVLAFAVGFYLPLSTGVAMMAGALVALIAGNNDEAGSGVLFAGGLITGEALMGISLAVPIVLSGDSTVLYILDEGLWYVSVVLGSVTLFCLHSSGGSDNISRIPRKLTRYFPVFERESDEDGL